MKQKTGLDVNMVLCVLSLLGVAKSKVVKEFVDNEANVTLVCVRKPRFTDHKCLWACGSIPGICSREAVRAGVLHQPKYVAQTCYVLPNQVLLDIGELAGEIAVP